VRFASWQRRYGKPVSELPTVKDQLGRMQSQLMTARLTAYHAVHLLDRGQPCDAELQNAKLVNAEYALDSARPAVEIRGAHALFPEDSPIARYQRDAFHILPYTRFPGVRTVGGRHATEGHNCPVKHTSAYLRRY
jgi:alkylation response protein AidB-like acyl-CoA dehydrogenase